MLNEENWVCEKNEKDRIYILCMMKRKCMMLEYYGLIVKMDFFMYLGCEFKFCWRELLYDVFGYI